MSRVLIRPSVVKPSEAGAFFVNDEQLPFGTAPLRIDSLIDGMVLAGRRVFPGGRPLDRLSGFIVPIVAIDPRHFKFLPAIPLGAGPQLHRNEPFFCFPIRRVVPWIRCRREGRAYRNQ